MLCNVLYEPWNPEHIQRVHKMWTDPMGTERVPGYFKTMLTRGTKILEDREIRRAFYRTSEGTPLPQVSPKIVKYTGSLGPPEWADVEEDNFETLCCVKADISNAPYKSKVIGEKTGYRRDYDVILLVGLTELKAQVSWVDANGEEKRSPAVVVYDNLSEEI